MAGVVLDAPVLKQRAGVSARGRKLKDPCFHLMLSWAPGENPTKQEILGASKGALKALGLDGHQAMIAAHTDRHHRHTHLAVNRVSTEDGRAVNLRQCGRVLSAWAEKYERDHGGIRIPNRVERRQVLNEPLQPPYERKQPPMQPTTGPGRRPRLPAERRGWNRHYQRQRAAAETARQAGRKPDPAVERRRRVRRARRQRMIRPVRVGIAAGQTAVTALGRATTSRIRSAARRARTTGRATTSRIRSAAATITRPRTDAAEVNERANRRALAYLNPPDRPDVLRHVVTATQSVGFALAATIKGVGAAIMAPAAAAEPRAPRRSTSPSTSAPAPNRPVPSPAPTARPSPSAAEKQSEPRAQSELRGTSRAAELAKLTDATDQLRTTARETPLNINCARAAQAVIDVEPSSLDRHVDATAAMSAAFAKLIDTLPEDQSRFPKSLVQKHGMRSGAPSAAHWVIETLRYEAPDEHRTFVIENQRKFLQTKTAARTTAPPSAEPPTAPQAPAQPQPRVEPAPEPPPEPALDADAPRRRRSHRSPSTSSRRPLPRLNNRRSSAKLSASSTGGRGTTSHSAWSRRASDPAKRHPSKSARPSSWRSSTSGRRGRGQNPHESPTRRAQPAPRSSRTEAAAATSDPRPPPLKPLRMPLSGRPGRLPDRRAPRGRLRRRPRRPRRQAAAGVRTRLKRPRRTDAHDQSPAPTARRARLRRRSRPRAATVDCPDLLPPVDLETPAHGEKGRAPRCARLPSQAPHPATPPYYRDPPRCARRSPPPPGVVQRQR